MPSNSAMEAKIDEINKEYTKANEEFNNSPLSERDYVKARQDIAKRPT